MLLDHSFLKHLLELHVYFFWKWLDWVSILVNHLLPLFRQTLLVLSILEKFDNLLGGKILSNVADLVWSSLDIAFLFVFQLVLELGIAFTVFLFWRRFVDDGFGLILLLMVQVCHHVYLFQVLPTFFVKFWLWHEVLRILLLLKLHLLLLLLQKHVCLKLLVVQHVVLEILALDLLLNFVELLCSLIWLRPLTLQIFLYLRIA